MSAPAIIPNSFNSGSIEPQHLLKRQLYVIGIASACTLGAFLFWPGLSQWFLSSDFLPHSYCYLKSPGLVWTNAVADSLIAISYVAISLTLVYVGHKGRRDIPLPWMFQTFGLFILICGATHFVEVFTIWIPVYILSAAIKLLTAAISITAATVLPFTVPQVFGLVQQAKTSERVTNQLRDSEARKEALLQEVHHRVKNNLAVICSLFYLQSAHTKDMETVQIFRDMERRVHSMALVHESLQGSEAQGRIDFAVYARDLARDILASQGGLHGKVRMKIELAKVMMSVDLAILCGLILNELIVNAFKHGFQNGVGGEIKLTMRLATDGECSLCVEDDGGGTPADINPKTAKSLGLRLVGSLTRQIRGSFELVKADRGTLACLRFKVLQ